MNLKNKTLALVVASALVMPSALAVEGSDGMHYTSASEGFYASIRVRFNSGNTDGANVALEDSSSRLGVQGTSEMSHGLEGFYRYETAFGVNNGEQGFGNTRLAYVGMRGGFGSLRIGSDWADEYNFVYGNTDIANLSGNFAYNDDYAGRSSRSIFYKSPDFNGLQVAARFELDGGNDKQERVIVEGTPTVGGNCPSVSDLSDVTSINVIGVTEDMKGVAGIALPAGCNYATESVDSNDADLDAWALSAKYAFSGFTVAGTYLNRPDYEKAVLGLGDLKDKTAWALGATYGQDNWNVATWYGENNKSDLSGTVTDGNTTVTAEYDDQTVFSMAGKVNVGPTGVYVVHETRDVGVDDAYTILGVEYHFNSKAKTWIEYVGQDLDTNDAAEDYVAIGLRHDF